MSDVNELEKRIREKLDAQQRQRDLRQNHAARLMREYEEQHHRFTTLADRLMEAVVRPRLQTVAKHFDNARILEDDPAGRHHCVCQFLHTERFPASVKLELAVSRDGDFENLLVLYDLEIIPVFFAFERRDQLTLPLAAVSEARIAAWVEEKMVHFVDTYLRLANAPRYQEGNMAIDPVCGMHVNKAHAARMEYRGATYYFCIPDCQRQFAGDPERFLAACPGGKFGAAADN
jgi:YHS domain-containing protein